MGYQSQNSYDDQCRKDALLNELRTARLELNLSQRELAEAAKVPPSAIARFENFDQGGPPLSVTEPIVRVCDALGIDLVEFGFDAEAVAAKKKELKL